MCPSAAGDELGGELPPQSGRARRPGSASSRRLDRCALDALVRRVGPFRALAYLASCDASMRREFVRDAPYMVSHEGKSLERLLQTIERSGDDVLRDEVAVPNANHAFARVAYPRRAISTGGAAWG